MAIGAALRAVMLDPQVPWLTRGTAARLLALDDVSKVTTDMLRLFFTQTTSIELWETALTIEHSGMQEAVPGLVRALHDSNHDRRHAAARALGWIQPVGKRAAKALVRALLDQSQPTAVREEAAESLAYSHYRGATEPLISVLAEPDVSIRFWAVFALGKQRDPVEPRVIRALQEKLADEEVPPGNWWSVGREALAMLGNLDPQYAAKLDSETQRVLQDTHASPDDRRWAESYAWP